MFNLKQERRFLDLMSGVRNTNGISIDKMVKIFKKQEVEVREFLVTLKAPSL